MLDAKNMSGSLKRPASVTRGVVGFGLSREYLSRVEGLRLNWYVLEGYYTGWFWNSVLLGYCTLILFRRVTAIVRRVINLYNFACRSWDRLT